MTKSIMIISLFLLTAFGITSYAQEIHINPFQIQSTDLTISIWGVTSVPNAQYEIALRYKNQPWLTVQSTTAPFAGTGFIGLHIVTPIASLQPGDIYRAFGTLVDATIMRTCTVIYVVRKCHNRDNIYCPQRIGTSYLVDQLPGGSARNVSISSRHDTHGNIPDVNRIYSDDNVSVIDLGNGLELYKTSEEELLLGESKASLKNIRVTTYGKTITFINTANLNFEFHIIDMLGKEVDSGIIPGFMESTITEMNIKTGIYFATLIDINSGEIVSKKIVIED